MQDDATVNDAAPDDAATATSEGGDGKARETPADADGLREDVKATIKRAAEAKTERHEAQDGPKATPTQHEADAVTASRTPTGEAGRAVQEAAQAKATQQAEGDDAERPRYRSAKQLAADELLESSEDTAGGS